MLSIENIEENNISVKNFFFERPPFQSNQGSCKPWLVPTPHTTQGDTDTDDSSFGDHTDSDEEQDDFDPFASSEDEGDKEFDQVSVGGGSNRRMCVECRILADPPYPATIDWETNVNAKAYCQRCYNQKQSEWDLLANTDKATKKSKNKKNKS